MSPLCSHVTIMSQNNEFSVNHYLLQIDNLEPSPPDPPIELAFRVERSTSDVFTPGSFITGGADIAEHIIVSEPVEAGDRGSTTISV